MTSSPPTRRADHPRIRGEHVKNGTFSTGMVGSSPHTRGAPGFGAVVDPESGIIPAYAGSTAVDVGPNRRRRGSSPHTRGAPYTRSTATGRSGIIPAYAGSTAPRRSTLWTVADHPRIRGEHWLMVPLSTHLFGSSPHTRGAPPDLVRYPEGARIIPAYAGSTCMRFTATAR